METINMITNADVSNVLAGVDKGNKKEQIDIKDAKQSIVYIKGLLKAQGVNKLIKVKASKIKDKVMYTTEFLGRIYIAEFAADSNFNDNTEQVLKKIQDSLKVEETYSGTSMTRQQKRNHLRTKTKYFQEKKKMNFDEWSQLIKANREDGNKRNEAFMNNQVRRNIEFFVDREVTYRQQLKDLGEDGASIEAHVEKWYESAIKEDSFMSEK